MCVYIYIYIYMYTHMRYPRDPDPEIRKGKATGDNAFHMFLFSWFIFGV